MTASNRLASEPEPEPEPEPAADSTKPRIIACGSPLTGHVLPVIKVVDGLVQRGYSVTLITGDEFRARVEAVGAAFVGIPATTYHAAVQHKRRGLADRTWFARKMFLEPTAERGAALRRVLERERAEHPRDAVVVLTEPFFLGDQPMYLGGPPLPRGFAERPRTVSIHAIPYTLPSRDHAPSASGILPDYTDESRSTYPALYEQRAARLAETTAAQRRMLLGLGCAEPPAMPWPDLMVTSADVVLLMCPPSLEYARSDLHPRFRFAGALPPAPPRDFAPPPFWDEVVAAAAAAAAAVVVVTQGTFAVDYAHLLMPALRALAARPDLLVVAILGREGARLPDGAVPPNARVADFLPYDAVLPHAAVFVTNAGYGGFIHAVLNGVPMVLAGDTEDKPDNAARGEYAGIAVNLRTGSPSEQQILEGVETVLRDGRYKKRVMQIKQENEDMRAMDTVERTILDMAGPERQAESK
ncbi:uncharacterized protein UV8b_01806 [Ustilaginoidea virens]|uniref:Uncharacterized protein n=2 Tax=Ustilaginoidea virens TaxID=1159556 RepID=A0A8E5HLQ1_USTVR|nr:uncharacterized protein UV8b_01806 [Ustilaginoidea virens]QUC17565.1 hypothetical protein UV8b_01806 [Ustilaginoidea virens]